MANQSNPAAKTARSSKGRTGDSKSASPPGVRSRDFTAECPTQTPVQQNSLTDPTEPTGAPDLETASLTPQPATDDQNLTAAPTGSGLLPPSLEAASPLETSALASAVNSLNPRVQPNLTGSADSLQGPAIEIITGTIGGVGKTQFAHLLVAYYFNRMLSTGRLEPISLVEADHKGTKFHRAYQQLPQPFSLMVNSLSLIQLSDDPAQMANADLVVETALETGGPVVVNTPANSAEALNGWIRNSEISCLCQKAGIPLRYWFVVRDSADSLNAFIDSYSTMGDQVGHILVQNWYSGSSSLLTAGWPLPKPIAAVVTQGQIPVVQMQPLFLQNQGFSERFYLPFEVARTYDLDSFSATYWQSRLAAGDPVISRWAEWSGSSASAFADQWATYWKEKGLYSSSPTPAQKQAFMKQHDLPTGIVGRNRLQKFLTYSYGEIAAALDASNRL